MNSDSVASSDMRIPATARIRRDGWRGEFVAGTPLHAWLTAGGRPDQIGSPSDQLVRDGSRSRCYRIEQLDADSAVLDSPMFFKVYRIRPGVQSWFKRRIGWHRPSWAWRLGWILHGLGIDVARPWGYLVPDPWRMRKCSYFWTEWIDGAQHARSVAQDEPGRTRLTGEYWFAHRVADMLGRLHNAGVYHRDMNWGNLLVNESSQRVWLIDLDSTHRLSLKPRTSACRDVARFLMEASEYDVAELWKDEFFERYAAHRGVDRRSLERDVQDLMRMFYRRRAKKLGNTVSRPSGEQV